MPILMEDDNSVLMDNSKNNDASANKATGFGT